MNVYRVEHSESQRGPYTSSTGDDMDDFIEKYWGARCPGPTDDGIRRTRLEEFFGFVSIRQMLDWFLLWDIWKWKKKGFAVYRYQISDKYVRLGGKQLVFVRAQAQSRQRIRWLPF